VDVMRDLSLLMECCGTSYRLNPYE